jgi:hypothetical protein
VNTNTAKDVILEDGSVIDVKDMSDQIKIENLGYLVRRLSTALKRHTDKEDVLIAHSLQFVNDHVGKPKTLRNSDEKQT